MTASFFVHITGDVQFFDALNRLASFARRPALAMKKIAAELEDQTEKNFAAQGRPRWRTLAEATRFARVGGSRGYKKNGELKKRSQRILQEMKILQDTGLLASSVSSRAGADFVAIGASMPYARIHQLGGKAGRGRKVEIPSRPYLPFNGDFVLQPEAERAVVKIAGEELEGAVR